MARQNNELAEYSPRVKPESQPIVYRLSPLVKGVTI